MAMCFDSGASPQVRFSHIPEVVSPEQVPCGWGFGWYPEGDRAACVVKDPISRGDGAMVRMLQDWSHFRSTVFLSFALGAADRRSQQDTHPFQLRHAGRDWLLSHNGKLENYAEQLPLNCYEPAGNTDSEHVLCWLGGQLREHGAERLSDLGWERLHQMLRHVNELGSANLVLTDGIDLVFYHDCNGHHQVLWTRRLPTVRPAQLRTGLLSLDLDDAVEHNRTAVIFSTLPPEDEEWVRMHPGQMLVARRGTLMWNSHPDSPHQMMSTGAPVSAAAPRAISRTYRVLHETVYRYTRAVERSSHTLRLRPLFDGYQQIVEHRLDISVPCTRRDYEDVFGNQVVSLEVEQPFEELCIRAESVVKLSEPLWHQQEVPRNRVSIPLVWMPWQRTMMAPYLLPPELPENQLLELSDFAMAAVERCDYHLMDTLIHLNELISRDFTYLPRSTTLATTPFEVLTNRYGVCQDFTNLFICLARLLAIPARYRVGYIRTGADYANQIQSEASHAWVECFLPWIGWVGFDPTNGKVVDLDHIRVACGRTFVDATPTSGTLFGGGEGETLSVLVRTELLEEIRV
jgi:transglutaminase-like putative cysteine protease/predicted glutamine amidotransferase